MNKEKHKINWKTRFKMTINIYLSMVPFLDHSLVAMGLAWLNEAMSHAMQGQPGQTGHRGEF